MKDLYKNAKNKSKHLANAIFDKTPKTIQRGILGGLVAAGGAAAQPALHQAGLDDLVNEAQASERTVILDVDPIIEEITPLEQFRVEQYDLESMGHPAGTKGFRIYRDQNMDFNADMSHTEMRTYPTPLGDLGDTTIVDLRAVLPINAPISKPTGGHRDLAGDPDPIISNHFDYQTYFDFASGGDFLFFHNKGTRTIYIDTSNATPIESQIMQEEIEAYNLQEWNTPTNIYSEEIGAPGFAVGDTITWKANVYDDLGAATGSVDWDNDEIQVARDSADFRKTFRAELGNTMMLSGFNIYSEDKEQLELIDIYAARVRNFSNLQHQNYSSLEGMFDLNTQFYPNSSQSGEGWPKELPPEGPESVYWLDSNGTVVFDPDRIGTAAPSIDKLVASLQQNTPNPFNPNTTINYSLPESGPVKIDVYDVKGRHVDTLVDGVMPEGEYITRWDGKDKLGNEVGSGTYLYNLTTEQGTTSKKMTLLK